MSTRRLENTAFRLSTFSTANRRHSLSNDIPTFDLPRNHQVQGRVGRACGRQAAGARGRRGVPGPDRVRVVPRPVMFGPGDVGRRAAKRGGEHIAPPPGVSAVRGARSAGKEGVGLGQPSWGGVCRPWTIPSAVCTPSALRTPRPMPGLSAWVPESPALERSDTVQTPGSWAGVHSESFQTPSAEPRFSGQPSRVRHDLPPWADVSTPPQSAARGSGSGRAPLGVRSSAAQNANQGRGRFTGGDSPLRLSTPNGVTWRPDRGHSSLRPAKQSPALPGCGLRASAADGCAFAHLSADWCCPSGSPDGAVVEGYELLREVLDAVCGTHFAFSFSDYAADFDGLELQQKLQLLSEPAWGLDAPCRRAIAAEYERRSGPRVRLDDRMFGARAEGVVNITTTPRALTRSSPLVRDAGAYSIFDADYCSVCSSECTHRGALGGSPRQLSARDVSLLLRARETTAPMPCAPVQSERLPHGQHGPLGIHPREPFDQAQRVQAACKQVPMAAARSWRRHSAAVLHARPQAAA